MASFQNVNVNVRVSDRLKELMLDVVDNNEDQFSSVGHYVRCLVIRDLRSRGVRV